MPTTRIEAFSKTAQILHLEDRALDRELAERMLLEAGIDCEIKAVETREDFVEMLRLREWDLIMSDNTLPAFDGMQALEIAVRTCPATPFIFLTGTLGEDNAVESLKVGATDYVLKQSIARLVPAVQRALKERFNLIVHQQAQRKLALREQQVHFMAYHDALTHLPNRCLFQDRLSKAIIHARRYRDKVALLFIDLDEFKLVNDSLGHSVGDLVLQQVAERLVRCSRKCDTVARLGGDEFAIVLGSVNDTTDVAIAADRINRTIATEFEISGTSLSSSCSIGISVYPDDGADNETLLKHADAALFAAKEDGRNRWSFFTADMNERASERLLLENGLRQALTRKQIYSEYQPQIDLCTGKIVGVEALCRWHHPKLGLIPPQKFIPVAEGNGEILRIGEWMIKTACTQAKKWLDQGIAPLTIAVNVSAVQLRQDSFPQILRRILAETQLPAEALELEVTESLLLSREDIVERFVNQLNEIGLKLSIDDFGTGYCGLSYLRRFRFSKLKIDRSFIRSITADERDAALTASIISIAKSLKMKVIAECVETEAQANLLRSDGCDQFQGYYFSPPLTAQEFEKKFWQNNASLQRAQFPGFHARPVRRHAVRGSILRSGT